MSDSSDSSFSDQDARMQEELLVQRYGAAMLLKQKPLLMRKKSSVRRFFDSADYSMQKEGKLENDILLGYDCPVDQLPVKSERTSWSGRSRSHLDQVAWPQPVGLSAPVQRSVIDI